MKNLFSQISNAGPKLKNNGQLKVLSWNVQSPSLERSKRQVEYILEAKADILVLTELKNGKGFDNYLMSLEMHGYDCYYHRGDVTGDYITLIATKGLKANISQYHRFSGLEPRAILVDVYFKLGAISILGIYMPSFHPDYSTKEKINTKERFNKQFLSAITQYFSGSSNRLVLAGDLNILEPKHQPKVRGYEQWESVYKDFIKLGMFDCFRHISPMAKEHSWISRQNEGHRFDHFFCDVRMAKSVNKCYYDHSARFDKLSDHSAMFLELFSSSSQETASRCTGRSNSNGLS
ncbi:endonuclease/exonuclease/phosphatase family protein [Pseudoalteromonas maricaloris]|uniref:endonuclease/exonuclease/phosphatase family protein n=1 Tax=Pseudoalteromonas maricaloris TaxID=184924 RepID=UPI003C1DC66F